MLVRLMYASRAVGAMGHDDLAAVLKQAKAHNASAGITGLLCYCAGSNTFMQALEGGRAQVNALYNRIAQDERHTDGEWQVLGLDDGVGVRAGGDQQRSHREKDAEGDGDAARGRRALNGHGTRASAFRGRRGRRPGSPRC